MSSPYQRDAIKIAKKYSLPPKIFLKLVNQESGWQPQARSPSGALGLTQLMPGTAHGLGVKNPFDPLENLDGGARYLRSQLDRFGSIRLALAAYNAGPGNVVNGNWEQIKETQRYVASILGSDPGTEVTPSGGIRSEHTLPARPIVTPPPASDSLFGSPAGDAAFSQLGRIAMGEKPTSVLATPPVLPPTPLLPPTPPPALPQPHPKEPPLVHSGTGSPIPKRDLSSIGGEHQTSGLPGFPAHDYFAAAGSPVVAPIGGTIVRLSGHNPAQGPTSGVHGPFGYSIYLKGDDGKVYYLTHLGTRNVRVGQRVDGGARIGTVGNYARYGGANHVHMGVH